ncbi:M protein [Streptococcus pyogenes]|nr:M protein [Streptococcus pyogenes]VGQ72007.1 M protein [Streptococcus pyogenes]VHC84200.1 M protein [Streptococcus pyogenes]VHM08697.1 M protein [Streptococcus pyogenes]
MAKNTTNRHYSLRKLKTGTASVAVALTVVGAGLVAGQTVRADQSHSDLITEKQRLRDLGDKFEKLNNRSQRYLQQYYEGMRNDFPGEWYVQQLKSLNHELEQAYNELSGEAHKNALGKLGIDNADLKAKIDELKKSVKEKNDDLSEIKKKLEEAEQDIQFGREVHAADLVRHKQEIAGKENVISKLNGELQPLKQKVDETDRNLQQEKQKVLSLEQQLAVTKENAKKDFELAALGHQLADKEYNAKIAELESKLADAKKDFELAALGHQHAHNEYQAKLAEKDDQIKQLEEQKQILDASRKGTARDLEAVRQAKKATEAELNNLKAELAKVTEQKQILDASRKGTARDLEAVRKAKAQVEAALKQLEEQNKISEASRKGLRRDLDASREAKKQVEKDLANLTAELDKVKEDKQISDASRQGLRRDLDASREAKKQVEKALEEANSKLAALEKLNKELEESKKLTEKEKAELQAKLEAEAKALKEQLAKQAEELAKLRAGKASGSQTPDTKPGNKAVPGKGQAPQAGTKPSQNKAPMKETKRQLPSTGEAANPFFTAAALTVMATAGVAAVVKRKEEN